MRYHCTIRPGRAYARRVVLTLLGCTPVLLSAQSKGTSGSGAKGAVDWYSVVVRDTLTGRQIIARPTDIARLPDGRYLVVDQSEKNIKLYDRSGSLESVLGRAGGGPGEFLSLASGGWAGGRPFGFDRATNSVKWFSSALKYDVATTIDLHDRPQPYRVIALPGGQFLECSFAAGIAGQNLIAVRDTDGKVVSSAFPLTASIARPSVAQYTVTLCDSRDGVVYGALSGGDSVHAFDLEGKPIASAPLLLDGKRIKGFATLVDENQGSARLKDGGWVQHGMQMAIRITAMVDGFVAVQVIEFDAVKGADVVEGGKLAVLRLRDRKLTPVGTVSVKAGLFNASDRGAYLLGWVGRGAERVELSELVIRRTLP
jgi:hypothetical protein